jgi:hypothetical protein
MSMVMVQAKAGGGGGFLESNEEEESEDCDYKSPLKRLIGIAPSKSKNNYSNV